ncbi:hypothetical protein TSUD_293000 [Trifolium subterraneum]|uniref:Uncharacterized protein n=1 Tax=Trifolium subterraneum TaxID=3900 RepID=A0A2Z6N588_TRISU|nr:hypothetical protein TSUD_293000 [Trifolium subterraneum]
MGFNDKHFHTKPSFKLSKNEIPKPNKITFNDLTASPTDIHREKSSFQMLTSLISSRKIEQIPVIDAEKKSFDHLRFDINYRLESKSHMDIQITGRKFYAQINVRQILTQGISES